MKKQNRPPATLAMGLTRREISGCFGNMTAWQQQNWTRLDMKILAILIQWENVPQATSYQERKQMLSQTVGTKLMHVITILSPAHRIPRLTVSFIWQGRHWKHPILVYGDWQVQE
jgi:hypothetical protein